MTSFAAIRRADATAACFGLLPRWTAARDTSQADSMADDLSSSFEHWLELESDYCQCRDVRDRILDRARQERFGERALLAIRLALEEALVNAVKHGNRNDREKKVRVAYAVTSSVVRIRIADEGPGFNPDDVPDPTAPENLETPGGRGLLLIRTFMSRVEYLGCGNTVEMWLEAGERVSE